MTNREAKHLMIKLWNILADEGLHFAQEYVMAYDMAIKALEQEPMTGHWIDTDPDDAYFYMCLNCHGRTDIKFDYCPICGCRMIEPKYCDRNICIRNDYNGIGCDECEIIKSQKSHL